MNVKQRLDRLERLRPSAMPSAELIDAVGLLTEEQQEDVLLADKIYRECDADEWTDEQRAILGRAQEHIEEFIKGLTCTHI
jgi:uncharacterized protein (DUF2235 family)